MKQLVQVYFTVGVVAVASPYAVFRAVDVIWPPPVPPVADSVITALMPARRPRNRRPCAVVQGELFPAMALGM